MDRRLFADIEETHNHEEKLRQESIALMAADPELSLRLEMIQKAMAFITTRDDSEGYGVNLRLHDRA
jgi:hypothetical protein